MSNFQKACIQVYVDTHLKLKLEDCIKRRNIISTRLTSFNQLIQTLMIFKSQREKSILPIKSNENKYVIQNKSNENKESDEINQSKSLESLEAFMDLGLHHYVKVVVPDHEIVPTAIEIGANTKIVCKDLDEAISLTQTIINNLEIQFKNIQNEAVTIRDTIKSCLSEYRALSIASNM